jgi:hypothetical protein
MTTNVRLRFDKFNDAVDNAMNLETGASLYIWYHSEDKKWMLTNWNRMDEKQGNGIFMCIRPVCDLSPEWLHSEFKPTEEKANGPE